MQGDKQLAIAEFFGEANQILKAHEELEEIKEAFEDYCNNQNIDTLKHTLNECNDLVNVLEGLYQLIGGDLEEIAIEKEFKATRTMCIIDQCEEGKNRVEEYDRIRRG